MNRTQTILGLGLLVTGLLAAGTASDGAPSSAPAPVAAQLIGDAHVGKETFTQYCSICHGKVAQGFIGPHIGGITWTVPGLHAIVRNGVGGYGGMPAFNPNAVTDQNIADIEAYLASLAPASAAAAQALPAPTTTAIVAVLAPTSVPPAASATSTPAAASSAPVAAASADLGHGRQIYSTTCSGCHGASGQGGFGPSLRGEKSRKDTAAAIAWIKNPKSPMPKLYPDPLSEKDVEDVAAYVESL
jgi:mono/diheme cytochrome c family protein